MSHQSQIQINGKGYILTTPHQQDDDFYKRIERQSPWVTTYFNPRVTNLKRRLTDLYAEIDLVQIESSREEHDRSTRGYYTSLLTQLRTMVELHHQELNRIQE